MDDQAKALLRVAAALERLAPGPTGPTDWLAYPAYFWGTDRVRGLPAIESPALDLLRGIDAQKAVVAGNVRRHARGAAAHDMLLWGARGMGKSALVRAATARAQAEQPVALALVQVAAEALDTLPSLFATLSRVERRFLVFIDDLGFAEDEADGPRRLRSWLDGGVEARPRNVRLAVTGNRRAVVARGMAEQDDPLSPRDAIDDRLALADRFGISVGFHACSQDDYLAIVSGYAAHYRLDWKETDALEWAKRRGSRSGRVAWHYVVELAGRAGRLL